MQLHTEFVCVQVWCVCAGMVKSCCAVLVDAPIAILRVVGSTSFDFQHTKQRIRWMAVVDWKNLTPNEYSRLCSTHFIRGVQSNDLRVQTFGVLPHRHS